MSYKNFPQQTRSATLSAETFNEKDNTVDVFLPVAHPSSGTTAQVRLWKNC